MPTEPHSHTLGALTLLIILLILKCKCNYISYYDGMNEKEEVLIEDESFIDEYDYFYLDEFILASKWQDNTFWDDIDYIQSHDVDGASVLRKCIFNLCLCEYSSSDQAYSPYNLHKCYSSDIEYFNVFNDNDYDEQHSEMTRVWSNIEEQSDYHHIFNILHEKAEHFLKQLQNWARRQLHYIQDNDQILIAISNKIRETTALGDERNIYEYAITENLKELCPGIEEDRNAKVYSDWSKEIDAGLSQIRRLRYYFICDCMFFSIRRLGRSWL